MTTPEAPDIEGLLRQLGPQVLGARTPGRKPPLRR